jgi:hypothetical protein
MGDGIHVAIYATGLGVWIAIAFAVGWVLFEIGIGAVAATSWCRWRAKVERVNGRPVRLKDIVEAFLARWVDFIGWRNKGRVDYFCPGSYWKGIGNWKARREPKLFEREHLGDDV